jgi:ATP-dependent protease ClpP protease subunit
MVHAGDRCLSMCVPIYLAGTKRVASPRSRWMFHQVRIRDAVSDEEIRTSAQVRSRSTDKLFDDYFRPAGVPDSWITVMRAQMRNGDVWRSGRALFDERAGIIQELSGN